MKKFLFTVFLLSAILPLQAQNRSTYNKALADSVGADEYGMRSYIFVILKTGPTVITDQHQSDSLFRLHMANITRLSQLNKLVLAGPYGSNSLKFRGLFILNVTTEEEARELLKTDPTIRAGIFEVEIIPWYGSAALQLLRDFQEQISIKAH
ncbi:MAG: YciI family protein [Chitinophagales bacterium]